MSEQYAYLEARETAGHVEIRSGTIAADALAQQLGQVHRGVRIYRRLSDAVIVGRVVGVTPLMHALHDGLVRISAEPQRLRRLKGGRHYYGVEPRGVTVIEGALGAVAGAWQRVPRDRTAGLVEIEGNAEVVERLTAALDPATAREDAEPTLPGEPDASAQLRTELLAQGWLSSDEVATKLGSAAANLAQMAARLRREGKLLGVWVPAQQAYRHPPCQFRDGELVPEMAALLSILPPGNGSGWNRAFWLYLPHARLDGAKPADVFAIDPGRVLEAAGAEFAEDADARW